MFSGGSLHLDGLEFQVRLNWGLIMFDGRHALSLDWSASSCKDQELRHSNDAHGSQNRGVSSTISLNDNECHIV